MARVMQIRRAAEPEDVRLLCTGQECGAREQCLRYKIRRGHGEYASYDLERQRLDKREDGTMAECPGYVDNRTRTNALGRR